jgi:outer membrane protein OmpA-like peptidoglycan-associated protein
MQQLIVLGVDPLRLDAKGYGEDHPVADNATDAGRAQNRRISMRVTAK